MFVDLGSTFFSSVLMLFTIYFLLKHLDLSDLYKAKEYKITGNKLGINSDFIDLKVFSAILFFHFQWQSSSHGIF